MKGKSIVVVAVVGCLVIGAMALAGQDRRVKLTSTKACTIDDSDFREVMPKAWDIMELDGVPGIPGAGIVLHSMEEGVVYLDEAGNVLRSRRVGRFESSAISPDGGILAVMAVSTVGWGGNVPTQRELTWLRVERATGELIWERKDGLGMGETKGSRFSVTNQGYVVVSSNIHDPYPSEYNGTIALPLIFDANGDLVARLPARFHRGSMSLSKDGGYCAIKFADLDAESPAGCPGEQHSAKQCVALFEVSTGRELWRHHFTQCESGYAALTEEAERVICGVTEAEWAEANKRYPGTHSLYVFDRQGKVVSRVDMKGRCSDFVFSPNEQFAAFSVFCSDAHDIVTLDPLDGRVVAEWSCEPRCHAYVFSVSDSATTAMGVEAVHPSGDTSTSTYYWALIDPEGTVIYEEPYEENNRPYVSLSADGKTLRKIWKGGIEQYALED